jgi:hypothetical protein
VLIFAAIASYSAQFTRDGHERHPSRCRHRHRGCRRLHTDDGTRRHGHLSFEIISRADNPGGLVRRASLVAAKVNLVIAKKFTSQ